MARDSIFRQEAIDRMQSPDDLQGLLTVVECRSWLILGSIGFICAAGLAWAFLGSIPVTVDGIGVLINPGAVRSLQSTAAGQIVEVRIRIGQELVKDKTVIAILNQPELEKQLAQEKEKRATLARNNELLAELDNERVRLEREFVASQKKSIEPELARTRELSEGMTERNQELMERQQSAVDQTRSRAAELNDVLAKRAKSVKSLGEEGLVADDLVLAAQREATDNELKVANLDVQLQELELKRIEAELSEMQRQNRVSELSFKIMELEIREKQAAQNATHDQMRRDTEIAELDRSIANLEELLDRQGAILSPFDGRVLEVTVSSGQVISPGSRIGAVEVASSPGGLRNLAYFQVGDGKRIRVGDTIYVTPSTVQRERYGSILGKVVGVSSFPITQEAAANVVGNAEVAQALMQRGGAIEVEAELEADLESISGFRWTSAGPPLKFSAGTTTSVRVTIERRAPISYVLPIFRTWVLGEKDTRVPEI